MEYIVSLLFEFCSLAISIACTVIVIKNRKHFDLWSGILTCAAWITKNIRRLCYDGMLIIMERMRDAGNLEGIFNNIPRASIFFNGLNSIVHTLLIAALIRIALIGLFLRWHNNAKKKLGV